MSYDFENQEAPKGSPPVPVQFVQSAPLGGVVPTAPVEERTSDRRDLVLTAALFVLAVVAGAASLMSWRDFGRRLGSPVVETGWVRADGSLGRGWIAVALAVLIAVAGVMIAAEKGRAGRVLAVLAGMALAVTAVVEWGLGAGSVRSGPGAGIWVELITGVLVVVLVGAFSAGPAPEPIPDD
jgi:hypothetical protein